MPYKWSIPVINNIQMQQVAEVYSSNQACNIVTRGPKGPDGVFGRHNRLLWICLSRLWSDWRSALAIVQPETVIAWHRAGFRLFWTWKVRHGQPGRPVISHEVRDLIRQMCRENPSWGAPRIHGELLKLGIDIGESSVRK